MMSWDVGGPMLMLLVLLIALALLIVCALMVLLVSSCSNCPSDSLSQVILVLFLMINVLRITAMLPEISFVTKENVFASQDTLQRSLPLEMKNAFQVRNFLVINLIFSSSTF